MTSGVIIKLELCRKWPSSCFRFNEQRRPASQQTLKWKYEWQQGIRHLKIREKSIPSRGYKFGVLWNRKVNLMWRESQIIQGFVNQEKEFGLYSKEALLRAMRRYFSQKGAAEVGILEGRGNKVECGKRNRGGKKDGSQYSPHQPW